MAFADTLLQAGVLVPGSLRSLALLSGARGCAGWLPSFTSIATSLHHCAVSLHAVTEGGELTADACTYDVSSLFALRACLLTFMVESLGDNMLRVYDAVLGCEELRSLCIQYNATSTLLQSIFTGSTTSVPALSPFWLAALADKLACPREPPSLLQEMSMIVLGSRASLTAPCADAMEVIAGVLCNKEHFPCFVRVSIQEPGYVVGKFQTAEEISAADILQGMFAGFRSRGVPVEVSINAV